MTYFGVDLNEIYRCNTLVVPAATAHRIRTNITIISPLYLSCRVYLFFFLLLLSCFRYRESIDSLFKYFGTTLFLYFLFVSNNNNNNNAASKL
ncbi:hypothetical protein DFA_08877 [Cavenderia fasciculata]|uniref:Uncharacterized protein n=1 Tax=Cavenderia fasciculata TaxID=261658 RepID=F4Q4T0_CACFS|nr:uncharacterized protein DFA_08877 [Cavenderia fasciculata]EGG17876.1 hypothetical protein DFA_08877 [Cavenderia fasciculata]|eukprot:XP_004356360.1 hypothetical protein DFA_08877 [Cavenderia fasciculata]